MRSELEIRTLIEGAERVVADSIKHGAPTYPTTMLEMHAYQMGRLSVLKWLTEEADNQAIHDSARTG